MICLANSLLDSTCAAAFVGPKIFSPSFETRLLRPETAYALVRRSSDRSDFFCEGDEPFHVTVADVHIRRDLLHARIARCGIDRCDLLLLDTACAIACSRPPLPMTNTFIFSHSLSFSVYFTLFPACLQSERPLFLTLKGIRGHGRTWKKCERLFRCCSPSIHIGILHSMAI